MLTKEEYLADPCGRSSLPWWKAQTVQPPPGVEIRHARELPGRRPAGERTVRYFRLIRPLEDPERPAPPAGFTVTALTPAEAAAHIAVCYADISASPAELEAWRAHRVYDEGLWIAVRDPDGRIAASGIVCRRACSSKLSCGMT